VIFEFPGNRNPNNNRHAKLFCMAAYKGHFRVICAVCARVIQPGKEGADTIVGVRRLQDAISD
jgi:hypothetical protein